MAHDGEMILDEMAQATGIEMYHLNGVPWHDAPKPRWLHRHWVQTSGWIGFDLVERCPCGALRNRRFGRGWIRK